MIKTDQAQTKVTPQPTSGTIPIAGKDIPIRPDTVGTTSQGSTATDLINGLREAAKKGIFSEPDSDANPK